MPGTMFIQAASLAALPTTGSGWTALTTKSTTDPGSGNLGALDQTHPLEVFSIALRWARDGGGLGQQYVINEIRAVMGTESSASQPLNPYRTLAVYVMAADLVDMPGSTVGANGQTFDAWMQSWPNKVIPGQSNWNTLEKCARTSGNNWGACARTSLYAVLLWLKKRNLQPTGHDRETLLANLIRWQKRWLGDTAQPNTFVPTGSFQSQWATSSFPGSQGVINPPVTGTKAWQVGANAEDASRSSYPTKTGSGQHYQWEAAESALMFAILAINAGHTDAAGWGGTPGLRGQFDYLVRNDLDVPSADFHRWFWMIPTAVNWLYPGAGVAVPPGWGGAGGSDRVQRRFLTTHTDWLTTTGSTWIKVGGSDPDDEEPPPVVVNPAIDFTMTVVDQSVLVSVTVTAAGSAPVSTYLFNMGDGTTIGPQSSATASHGYTITQARTFEITVTVVTTDGGTASRTKTTPTIFTPDAAPIARLTLGTLSGVAPLPVYWDLTASEDADGDPKTYAIDMGDGTAPYTTATGTHTYAEVTTRTDRTVSATVTAGGVTSAPVVRTVTLLPAYIRDLVGVTYVAYGGQKILLASGGIHFVIHGADAAKARPDIPIPIVWFGTVRPDNADSNLDVWVPVSDGT